jgi:HPt (histidine-containing phosphotransfer) domain-containing protein
MSYLVDDMQSQPNPYFDLDEALSIVDGDQALFQELVDLFRQNYPAELSSIREAISQRDGEALRLASHQFKGTLSALAAGPARESVMRLEAIGRNADLVQADAVYAEMEHQVRALDAALKGW